MCRRLFAATILEAPVTLHSADYVRLEIECEVAVRIGADMPASKAPYVRDSLADSIEFLTVAFELVDLRGVAAGTGQDAAAISGVCTNIFNAGAVLGTAVREWRGLDLAASRGVMVINGAQVGSGLGAEVMGHPLEPLVWLANMLAERGQALQTRHDRHHGKHYSAKTSQPRRYREYCHRRTGGGARTVI